MGSGFAADADRKFLPVDLKCFFGPKSSSTLLYSKSLKGAETLLGIDHDGEPTISYSIKEIGETEFSLQFKTPIKDIESSAGKLRQRYDFVLEQMRILDREVCEGPADARARMFELMRKNARDVNYQR